MTSEAASCWLVNDKRVRPLTFEVDHSQGADQLEGLAFVHLNTVVNVVFHTEIVIFNIVIHSLSLLSDSIFRRQKM